ncbi:MAG: PadR family transcriptional regulator [Planctomycetes bacterium]|nr:PadR family transcriptional regulator [Planctomycetota bacterium]
MKVNRSKLAIMGILSIRPMSGYDIKKTIEQSIGHFWSESFGQIYPILKKLVDEKLATQNAETPKGKLNRNIYTLTDKGLKELREWLSAPANTDMVRSEFVLKFFFGKQVKIKDNIRHVERERTRAIETSETLKEIKAILTKQKGGQPNLSYPVMTLNYGIHSTEATIKWCDETLRVLYKSVERKAKTT